MAESITFTISKTGQTGPAGTTEWDGITDKPETFPPIIGSGADEAVAGNDPRLGDARTPTAHKSTHATGGGDALTPADIGAATSEQGDLADSALQSINNALVNVAIAENPAASQAAMVLGSASVESVSLNGGISKVLMTDANGNLTLGNPTGIAGLGNGGKVFIPPFRKVVLMKANGAEGASIYLWDGHSNGDETIYESPRHCFYWTHGMQLGSPATLRDARHIYIQPNSATNSDTIVESPPVSLLNNYWNGSANVGQQCWIQSTALSASAGSEKLFINLGGAVGSDHRLTGGVEPVSITREGLTHLGQSPALSVLTDGATITQVCTKYKTIQAASVTLGGNRTLAISGAESGMRGVIYVKQDTTGSRTLTLPTGSAMQSTFALSTLGGRIDRLAWEYDGTNYFWTIDAGIEVAFDSDALAFFTRASISDATQKTAVNNLVLALKNNSLWSKIHAIYPMVGGNATAHSKNLKADAYNVTWTGSGVTHDSNGITGNASTAFGDTGFKFSDVTGQNNAAGYAYCKTTTPTANGYFFGVTGTTNGRFSIYPTGSANVSCEGPHFNSIGTITIGASSDFRKHFALNRSGASAYEFYVNSSSGTGISASTAAADLNEYILARNTAGSANGFTNANLGLVMFGQSLSSGEWTTFRSIVDTYQAALGRANP